MRTGIEQFIIIDCSFPDQSGCMRFLNFRPALPRLCL